MGSGGLGAPPMRRAQAHPLPLPHVFCFPAIPGPVLTAQTTRTPLPKVTTNIQDGVDPVTQRPSPSVLGAVLNYTGVPPVFIYDFTLDSPGARMRGRGLVGGTQMGRALCPAQPTMPQTTLPSSPRRFYPLPGSFWYHSHYSAQYADGLRGALVVHDPGASRFSVKPYAYEPVLFIQDWCAREGHCDWSWVGGGGRGGFWAGGQGWLAGCRTAAGSPPGRGGAPAR